MRTLLAIRHFPDKKRPCLVLEQGNQCVVLGYLTDRKREYWLRRAFCLAPRSQFAIGIECHKTIDELIASTEDKHIAERGTE